MLIVTLISLGVAGKFSSQQGQQSTETSSNSTEPPKRQPNDHTKHVLNEFSLNLNPSVDPCDDEEHLWRLGCSNVHNISRVYSLVTTCMCTVW